MQSFPQTSKPGYFRESLHTFCSNTRHLNRRVATRSAELARPIAIAAIASVTSFYSVRRIAEMSSQFGFRQVFERSGNQASEDAFFTTEIAQVLGAHQFVLHSFYRLDTPVTHLILHSLLKRTARMNSRRKHPNA